MMLTRCLRGSVCRAALPAVGGVTTQNVRFMGRGPTIQGRKNATDAVRVV
jgi:hypothetical protein